MEKKLDGAAAKERKPQKKSRKKEVLPIVTDGCCHKEKYGYEGDWTAA